MTALELADRLKLHPVRRGREWRGDCPACSYQGAFVLTQKEGRPLLWCASCRDRDAMTAILRGEHTGSPPPWQDDTHRAAMAASDAAKAARALALWSRSMPCAGTLAAAYLAARALPLLVSSPALRFCRDARHPSGGTMLALVALVQDVAEKPLAVHRTYLRPAGTGKADVEPNRASLGRLWRGAIRLHPLADELVVAEGIETAAAAGILLGLPAWAAVSAGNMACALALPPEVRRVVIAADHDKPGRQAAKEAATRWKAEGRTVRVALPDRPGEDFADVLAARGGPSHG